MSEIKITNKYFDRLEIAETIKSILKKDFACKTSYWLARIFNEIEDLSKTFGNEKQKIIDKYAKKDSNNEIIQDNGNITIIDVIAFTKELNELLEIDLVLSTSKIEFDLEEEPKCSIDEMLILLPLIEVKNA